MGERRRSLDALLSSDTDQWLTPLDFLAVLLRLGPVVFDPCGNPLSVVPAARQVLLPEDGLTASWPARGLVFCNPPYGRDLPACVHVDTEFTVRQPQDFWVFHHAVVDSEPRH
jgi:hypothetical protein